MKRGDEMRQTRAGIDWVRWVRWAAPKIALGIFADGFAKENDGIEAGTGFGTIKTKRRLVDTVEAILPGTASRFEQEYDSSVGATIYDVYYWRARHTHQKNELRVFRERMSPLFELVAEAYEIEQPLELHHLFLAQEQTIVTSGLANVPGVYIKVSPEKASSGYVGEGGVTSARASSHTRNLFLSRVYATFDKKSAKALQDALHDELEKTGMVKFRNGDYFLLAEGCNIVTVCDGIISSTSLRHFCRGKIGIESLANGRALSLGVGLW